MSERRLLHTLVLPVRWRDMDALGHVNNAVYFTYCESTRIAWLEKIGWAGSVSGQSETGPVVVNAALEFHKPAVYPVDVEVRLLADPPGRSSIQTYYELRDATKPEVIFASGGAKMVWVNYRAERSTPLPDSIRELLVAAEPAG